MLEKLDVFNGIIEQFFIWHVDTSNNSDEDVGTQCVSGLGLF